MASNAQHIQTVRADFLDGALYDASTESQELALSREALLTGLSRAFDLAEDRRQGHAQRVAFIACSLGEAMSLSDGRIADIFLASLLHDAGMARATQVERERIARLSPGTHGYARDGKDESAAQALAAHCQAGATLARKLGLRSAVAHAIATHHDAWDGKEASLRTAQGRADMVARVVAGADRIETLIDSESGPLHVRRNAAQHIAEMSGREIDPAIAEHAAELVSNDAFWLGIYDNDLGFHLMDAYASEALEPAEVLDFLGVISDLVDARSGRRGGRGRRVAELAEATAREHGMDDERAEAVHAAALLQDLGTLGVPVQMLKKPDILSVDEMASMQMHPAYARDILSEIPGMSRMAWWVGCHHERIDGKGYPAMLEGNEVPVEAQIIGIADAYEALTSERPYRPAMAPNDALEVIRGMVGTRFAEELQAPFDRALARIRRVTR